MIKHLCIVNRNNEAVIFANGTEEYKVVKDDNSTTMATLTATINILEKLVKDVEEGTYNEEDTMILLVPKTLGLMLKLDGPKEIKANGYKTVNGTKLTKNFVDTMIYANELREWLGTTVIRFKIHGSDILYPNEKRLINDCWNALNKMTNTKGKYNKNKKVERPAQAPQKPANVNVVFNNEIDELF
jgi:hypothetical protein